MDFSDFCSNIKYSVTAHLDSHLTEHALIKQRFLAELALLEASSDADTAANMTKATVLFEALYRCLPESALKQDLSLIRVKRWSQHFGTPTIAFLLSWQMQIDATIRLLEGDGVEAGSSSDVTLSEPYYVDSVNHLLANPACIARVQAPGSREVTGMFTKTHNPFGGFTTTPCDPVSQKFLEHAALSAQSGGKVLEIGAAFGAATLAAISKGATVFCNDIDPKNLAVVRQRYLETAPEDSESVTGDSSRLVLVPGALPDELIGLPEGQFDAILVCRVLHFFSGSKIEESLGLMSRLLTPGGKVYIVCETPFLRNWERFIPEYARRVESGMEWPGEITEPAAFESSGRSASLPKFVHWITKEVLERSLSKAGFEIEYAEYIDRKGQFPDDLLLSGQESVGAIARI